MSSGGHFFSFFLARLSPAGRAEVQATHIAPVRDGSRGARDAVGVISAAAAAHAARPRGPRGSAVPGVPGATAAAGSPPPRRSRRDAPGTRMVILRAASPQAHDARTRAAGRHWAHERGGRCRRGACGTPRSRMRPAGRGMGPLRGRFWTGPLPGHAPRQLNHKSPPRAPPGRRAGHDAHHEHRRQHAEHRVTMRIRRNMSAIGHSRGRNVRFGVIIVSDFATLNPEASATAHMPSGHWRATALYRIKGP